MKTHTIFAIVVAVLVVAAGGYWYWSHLMPGGRVVAGSNSAQNQNKQIVPLKGENAPVNPKVVVGLAFNDKIPMFLTGGNGMTLYTYDKDTKGVSNCSGTCATNWPPYTVASAAAAQSAANAGPNVGTIMRADGTVQVTYGGKPLYFYMGDAVAKDTTGDGVGGVWHVAKLQ